MKLPSVLLFVALLLALHAAAGVQLCPSVDKLAVLGNVDGFGSAFTDMSWVATQCATSPANYDSGWFSSSSVSTLSTELYELRVLQLFIRRTLSASVTGGVTSIHLQIEFQADLRSADYAVNASIQGYITKDLQGVALDALGFYPVSWRGSLSPNCPVGSDNCTLLYDIDLFDGLPASVLSPSLQPNVYQQSIVDEARRIVSDVNLLLGPLTSAPSALHGSIRGSFMQPSQNPLVKTIDGVYENNNVTVVQFSDTCSGIGCGVSLLSGLRDLVKEASQGKCSSLGDINGSFQGSIDTEIIVSAKSIWIHRVTANSKAVFQCGGLFIGVELSARAAAPSAWPVNIFANDIKAAVSMAKSLPLSLKGNMYGAIKVGSDYFTIISDDLFSIGRGGSLILDRLFDQSTAQTLLNSLYSSLRTNVPLMDNFLRGTVLRIDSFSTMANKYTNAVSSPRLLDFLQWLFRDEPRVSLVPASDGSVLTIVFSMSEKLPIPMSDTIIATANQAFNTLGTQLKAQFVDANAFPIPSITSSNDLTVATFTGLFTATVKIELMNNGTLVTPSILEANADFAGSFDLRPDFGNNMLLTSANFIQVVGQTPYVLGKLPTSIQQSAGKVAAYFDKLYTDAAWNTSLNFQSAFNVVLNGLAGQSWVMHPLQPFSTNFGAIAGDENLRSTLSWLNQTISSVASGVSLAQQWMDRITQITDNLSHVIALPVIQPDAALNRLKLSMDVFELTSLSIPHESMQWKTLGTSRMGLPAIIAKKLDTSLIFDNAAASIYNVASKALAKLEDWAVPFRHQMISGKVGNSRVSIDINLPDITIVDLQVDLIPDRGGDEINIKIFADQLLDSQYFPQFDLFTNNLMGISPSSLLLSLRDVIVQSAPLLYTGVLNFPIPPMTQSLGSVYDTIRHDIEDKIVPWLTSAVEDGPMFLLEVCSDRPNDMSLNLTINTIGQYCSLPMAATGSIQQLSDALANSLRQCTLGTFLTPRVTKRTSNDCGQISMYAAIPGIVWNLYGTIAGSNTPLQFNPVQEPMFASWLDMATVFRTLLKMASIEPEDKNVPIVDIQGLLPSELINVFNESYPAVFVELEMPLLGEKLQNLALNPALSSVDDALKMILPDGFINDVELKTSVGCKLGVVFEIPGTANISAFSDLGSSTGVTMNTTIVNGSNTFDIYVRAQYRSPTDRYFINFNTTVVLTPGLTFKEAFMTETFDQVNETIQGILTIEVDEGSTSLGLPEQIKITLVRKQLADDEWVLPISLQIANSVVPGLNNFTNEPASAHVVISAFHFDSSLSFSPSLSIPGSAQGVLGVLGLKNSGIKGDASVDISISQIEPYAALPAVASALITPSAFSQVFEADIDAHSNVNFFGYDLDVDSLTLPEIPSIDFLVNETIKRADASVLGDITRRLSTWNVDFKTANQQVKQAFQSFSSMDHVSLCSWSTQIAYAAQSLVFNQFPGSLPFSSITLDDVVGNGITSSINELTQSICEAEKGLTLRQFCSVMHDLWQQDICSHIRLSNNALAVDLELTQDQKSFASGMKLNIADLFGKDLPVLTGTSSMDITADFSFYVPLVATFANNSADLQVLDTFWFQADLDLKGSGTIGAYIGPLSLSLGDLNVFIGAPARVKAQKGSLAFTGQAGFSALVNFPTTQCRLAVDIADIGAFMSGAADSSVISQCKDGFLILLEEEMRNSPLFSYFSSPSQLLAQMEAGLGQLTTNIFGRNGVVGPLVLPLIGRAFEELLINDITSLTGPNTGRELIKGLSNMTNSMLKGKLDLSVDPFLLDKLVIAGFTDILCAVFKPTVCPPPPDINFGAKRSLGAEFKFSWPLLLARETSRQLTTFGFSLGDHGAASLEMSCKPTMNIAYSLVIRLEYSPTHGLQVLLDAGNVISASTALTIAGCALDGKIGFLGASIGAGPNSGINIAMNVDKVGDSLDANVDFQAELNGALELGLAGVNAAKSPGAGVYNAVPHWKAQARFSWDYVFGEDVKPPTLELGQLNMCVGSVLADVVRDVIKATDPILGPFNDVLGRDGILLKTIEPTKFVWGRPLTLLELLKVIAKDLCRSCAFDGVFECVDAFVMVGNIMSSVQQFKNIGADGCSVMQRVQDFNLDFSQPALIPSLQGSIPPINLVPRDPSPSFSMVGIEDAWAKVKAGAGLRFTLTENIPSHIINLLLGRDIRIMEFVIPPLTISASIMWPIPVWPIPLVTINLGISASLTVDIDRIIFTSAGIRHLIETGSPGSLISSLALPTVRPNGTPIWQLQGSVRLTGGVTVSILIVKGTAYIFIEFQAMARIPDLKGRGYVTFDELFSALGNGGLGALQKRLQLLAGFGIKLEACIPLLFTDFCYTVVGIEMSVVLWAYDSGEPRLNAPLTVGGNGALNLAAVPSGSQVVLYDNMDGSRHTTLIPPGGSPRSSDTPASVPMDFAGAGPNFNYVVKFVKQLVNLPPAASLTFVQSAFAAARKFTMKTNLVTSDTSSMGVAINYGCSAISLSEPLSSTAISILGLPCATTIDSLSTMNITLDGEPGQFNGAVIRVQNAVQNIVSTVKAKLFDISTSYMRGDGGVLNVDLTNTDVRTITTFGHPSSDNTFNIYAVPNTRKLTVNGGTEINKFNIPAVQNLEGVVMLRGGTAKLNYLTLTVDTPPAGLDIVTTATSFVYQQENTLLWENVKNRRFVINGNAAADSKFTMLKTDDYSFVEVQANGIAGSTIDQQITGCSGSSELRVSLNNDGNHNVYVGSNDAISDFACTLRITGGSGPSQMDTLIIQASADPRNLQWTINRERLIVFDASSTNNYFFMFFTSIERVILQVNNRSSVVNFVQGTEGTEFVINFPDTVEQTAKTSICSTEGAVMVSGSTNLWIGPNPDTCGTVYSTGLWENALSLINGLIAVDATRGPVNLFFSHEGNATTSQRYRLEQNCISALSSNLTAQAVSQPSSWMCDQIAMFSPLGACPTCPVMFTGEVVVSVTTGPSNDYFETKDTSLPIILNLGDGNDTVNIGSIDGGLSVNLGPGSDRAIFTYPLAAVQLDLGVDSDDDYIDVYTQGMNPMPQVNGNTFGPTNSMSSDLITVKNWNVKDVVHARSGQSPVARRSIQAAQMSTINLQNNGGELKMDVIDSGIYKVVGCSSPSTITFVANMSASDWVVNVTLPTIEYRTYLNVLSEKGNNGIVNIVLPPFSGVSDNLFLGYDVFSHANGTLKAYGLWSYLLDVDHIDLTSQEAIGLTLEGAPSDAEWAVHVPSSSIIILKQLTTPFLAVNTNTFLSAELLQGPMTYIAYGPESFTYLNCTFTDEVTFDGRLITNRTATSLSAWFKNQLDLLAVPYTAAEHVFGAFNAEQVTIAANFVNVIVPTFEPPVRHMIVDKGNLHLKDDSEWTNATISGTSLRVEPRYTMLLTSTFNGSVDTHFADGAVVLVQCNDSLTQLSYWTVGPHQPSMDWVGPSCLGSIGTSEIPNVNFTGTGVTHANLNLSALREVADNSLVTISESMFLLDSDTRLKFTKDSLTMSWSVLMSSFDHFILLTESAPWCDLVVSGSAVTNITSVSQYHALFPGREIIYEWQSKELLPTDQVNTSTCVQPNVMCSPNRWVDVEAHGTLWCEPQCTTYDITINTTLPVDCLVPLFSDGWSVVVKGNDIPSDPISTGLVMFGILYFLVIAVASVSNAFDGIMLVCGWAECVITASLFAVNAHDNTWSVEMRSIIMSADEVVHRLFTGWLCDSDMAYTVAPWIMVGAAVLVLAFSLLEITRPLPRYHFRKRVLIFSKLLASLTFFTYVPFFIARTTEISAPFCIPLVIIFARFVYDTVKPRLGRSSMNHNVVIWQWDVDEFEYGDDDIIKNILVNLALLIVGVVSSVFSRDEFASSYYMPYTWVAVALIVLSSGAAALRIWVMQTDFNDEGEKAVPYNNKLILRIFFPIIGVSMACGITFTVLLHYVPDLSSIGFGFLWGFWVLPIALLPVGMMVYKRWRIAEYRRPKGGDDDDKNVPSEREMATRALN